MPVDVYLPDVPAAADAPLAELRAAADRERRGSTVARLGETADGGARPGSRGDCSRRRPSRRSPPDGTLRLVSAPDPAREVRAAARACLQWARGGGAVLGDGGRLPARRGVSAAGRGGVHRGRDPGVPARGLAAGRAAARAPDARRCSALYDERALAPVGDGLPDRRAASRTSFTRSTAASRRPAGTRSRARRGSSAAPSSGSSGSRRCSGTWRRRRRRTVPDWVTRPGRGRRAARAVHRRARPPAARPAGAGDRGRSTSTTCRRCWPATSSRREEVVVALRGLERFTALEAEVDFERFLDVVRRAIETLRSEDVLDGQPGAFARARRERRRGQLAAPGSSSPACGSSARPSGRSRRRRGRTRSCSTTSERGSPSGPAPGSRRAADRGSEEALRVRARVRGGAGAAGRLLRAARDRREPAAAAVGVLPGARLAARGRARVGRGGAAASPRRRRSGSPATRSGRRSRAAATPRRRRRSARPLQRRSPRPSATAPTCRRASPRPVAIATFERAAPAFARALEADAGAPLEPLLASGTARSGRTRWPRSRRWCRADRVVVADRARELRALPAAVPDRRAAAGQSGRGARADGPDRRHSAAAACSTGSSSGSTANGTATVRRRSLAGARGADARDRRRGVRSAPRSAARPAIRRCGRRTGSR